jgi:cytochrome P450
MSKRIEVDVESFDLRALPEDFFVDPYRYYRALREHSPIYPCPDGSVLLTRYSDVTKVYRSRAMSSDKREMFKPTLRDGPIYEHHTTSLVFSDPPYHTRVRQAIQRALVARVLRSLESSLIELVDSLLDSIEDAGEFDLIEHFASAIPVEVIGNLLGVPRADRGPLRDWSLAILGALEPTLDAGSRQRANTAVDDFSAYLRELIGARRSNLVLDGSDALSEMINSGRGEGESPLTERELIHNTIFLLNAGHETTTNLIGNGIAALLENPAELARLRDHPVLIDSTVEELLRYESSNQLGNRLTTEAFDLGDVVLPAGTAITLCIGAANRDPEQFPDPDRLDISREPNRHVAFGMGIHACAGMQLARMEGRIAIGRMVRRFTTLESAGRAKRGGRVRFRGYLSYPMRAAR